MPLKRIENYYPAFLLVAIVIIEILLGLSPQSDRATWAMENLPIWILLPIIDRADLRQSQFATVELIRSK